mmetsp:Transcript_30207/g.77554  ORF Transcript_30207/g.77554 Transcript_30207/m.77554 type:complete len:221 (-) Transcript_30207:1535-2197(-)
MSSSRTLRPRGTGARCCWTRTSTPTQMPPGTTLTGFATTRSSLTPASHRTAASALTLRTTRPLTSLACCSPCRLMSWWRQRRRWWRRAAPCCLPSRRAWQPSTPSALPRQRWWRGRLPRRHLPCMRRSLPSSSAPPSCPPRPPPLGWTSSAAPASCTMLPDPTRQSSRRCQAWYQVPEGDWARLLPSLTRGLQCSGHAPRQRRRPRLAAAGRRHRRCLCR